MILIIDNYDSFTYNLYQMVAQCADSVQVIRNDQISIEQIAQLNPSGIILSPGPGKPEEAGICIAVIKAFSGIIPILGVCLGHQAIVHAFGGKVIRAQNVIHGKSTYVFHTRKGIFANMPLPFSAGRYHSLIAEKLSLPEVLSIEAENEQGLIMAVKHRAHLTYGVQFHPESILTPDGYELMNQFLKITEIQTC